MEKKKKNKNKNRNNPSWSNYEDFEDMRGKGVKKEKKRSHKRNMKRQLDDMIGFDYHDEVDNFERF